MARPKSTTLESELFLRLWGRQAMTPTLARSVLKLGWTDEERARMRDLLTRNKENEIDRDELSELDAFVNVGITLTILQSRARQFLKRHSTPKAREAKRG